ncbi:hypothetical protein HYV81_04050 [Candidatus Woesearchaeota archaeon]|nr:hypothetical protein [Candidatus Woesearchaeota archaeon]
MAKKQRGILHPKIVDIMHSSRLAKGFLVAGLAGITIALVIKPSVTGAAVVESAEMSSTAFFSTIVLIVSFMMVWTGIMIHLMRHEIPAK